MIGAIHLGASSLAAHSAVLNNTANNIANANTNGFKSSAVGLQSAGTAAGVAVGATSRTTGQGPLQVTGQPLDLAIAGEGFFQVQLPTGEIGFTRDGSFSVNANGQLVNADGNVLVPQIAIPPDATSVNVGRDGTVSVTTANTPNAQTIGNLTLARFTNPQGLVDGGHNLLFQTAASGGPFVGVPGQGAFGAIEQGVVEAANVDYVSELTTLLISQRAFELGTKVVRAGDEMYKATLDLIG